MQRVSTERVCYRGNTVNIKHSGTNHIFCVDINMKKLSPKTLKCIDFVATFCYTLCSNKRR
nr:MAG TPA: hypothetical protein [Caudoviricetes sp.]